MNKHVLSYMPWDDLLPEFANVGRILVVEHPQSEWVKSLRSLLGRLMDLKPTIKNWNGSSFDQGEFSQGADMLWRPRDGGTPGNAGGGSAIRVSGGTGGPLDTVPQFWDELKKKMHTSVVKAMETEH